MSSSHKKARSDCGSLRVGLPAPGVASYDRVRQFVLTLWQHQNCLIELMMMRYFYSIFDIKSVWQSKYQCSRETLLLLFPQGMQSLIRANHHVHFRLLTNMTVLSIHGKMRSKRRKVFDSFRKLTRYVRLLCQDQFYREFAFHLPRDAGQFLIC